MHVECMCSFYRVWTSSWRGKAVCTRPSSLEGVLEGATLVYQRVQMKIVVSHFILHCSSGMMFDIFSTRRAMGGKWGHGRWRGPTRWMCCPVLMQVCDSSGRGASEPIVLC